LKIKKKTRFIVSISVRVFTLLENKLCRLFAAPAHGLFLGDRAAEENFVENGRPDLIEVSVSGERQFHQKGGGRMQLLQLGSEIRFGFVVAGGQ
jgi:hypothetical protein